MLSQQDYIGACRRSSKKKKYTYIYIQIYNILNKHAERQLNIHRSIDPNCNLRPFTISQTRPRIS